MRSRAAVVALSAALAASTFLAPAASAQYFGQNQVQYRDFDFAVLKTAHFDLYYYPEQERHAAEVARLAERWYARFSKLFEHRMKDRQPLMLYASPADFRQTNIVAGLGEGTGGVTESFKRRIVMPSAGALAETDHVLGHELVHAFQYDTSTGKGRQASTNFYRLPLWFVEGMAEYLSLGPSDSQTAMWLRDAVQSKKLPTLKQLGNPRYFPYRFGHAFWAYVGGRWGDEAVMALFREGGRSGDPAQAIKKVLGEDEKTFSKGWNDSVRASYAGFLESSKAPTDYGPLLVSKKRGGGDLNLGPALSPDGKRVVFLSERDLVSIDLFLADADTGKVIRKLASTATDPHFDSLLFIESAGGWSADGRRFVQSALRKGKGAFFVIDTETGRRVDEVAFDDLPQLENPVFTPDGRRVIFTALQGGLLDLWEYDLETRRKRRLTNDAFAELQPTVSPDGRQLAFTTDRFTTRLDTLAFGPYRVGVLDLETGAVSELPAYPYARCSNPQWSPDGKTVFFLSDVRGATDIHRIDLATGELREVTRLRTGVYGITALSPSLSVARVSGRIAYTAREEGKHSIYAIDDPVKLAGTPVPAEVAARHDRAPSRAAEAVTEVAKPPSADTSAPVSSVLPPGLTPAEAAVAVGPIDGGSAVLPPYRRVESRVEGMLEDAQTGLPGAGKTPATQPYEPKLQLQHVGQPSIGVGVDRFGTYAAGSTALYFGDMLGNRNLAVALQTYGELRDIAGQVAYTNLTRRLDWGVGAQYVPYLYSGGYSSSLVDADGVPLIVDEYLIQRQTDVALFGVAAYPISRADRFELQTTLRRYSFSAERRTDVYSYETGEFLGQDETRIDTGLEPLYLGALSGAFVHDTSVFGATSPILGQRGRLEVGQTAGTVSYADVLADWRAYFMPVRPVTLALRALHYGRYGSAANDERFGSIYLGYTSFIRGYDGIEASECVPDATSTCPLYDRLFGSRILVANAELRAPLFGLLRGRLNYGPVPVEIAAFADAGVAWGGSCWTSGAGTSRACQSDDRKPSLFGGDQDFLVSVGVAGRVNVLGFLVLEVSYARPFQRSGKGWVWQWNLAPGF